MAERCLFRDARLSRNRLIVSLFKGLPDVLLGALHFRSSPPDDTLALGRARSSHQPSARTIEGMTDLFWRALPKF
jgi:hypothetical protein